MSQQLLQYIKTNLPQPTDNWTGCLTYEGQKVWVKYRIFSKKTTWHRLQSLLARQIAIPLFSPVVANGPESLANEALRLKLFASHGLLVPEVLGVTSEFIITNNVGIELQKYVKHLTDHAEKQRLLLLAAQALNNLHRAGLCHGRPLLRDMTYHNDQIYFIDLEENPLDVMSLSEAQARDIWLFLYGTVRYQDLFPSLLRDLYQICILNSSSCTVAALKQMVGLLRPIRAIYEHTLYKIIQGRDVRYAIQANKALEFILLHLEVSPSRAF